MSTARSSEQPRYKAAGNAAKTADPYALGESFPWSLIVASTLLAISHLAAAIYAPIQDCDEVFNYWEPTHYLTHGHGLQTWEYAPRFAIRSWAYAGFHALAIAAIRAGTTISSKATLFVVLRSLLGLVCVSCEVRLFHAISKTMNQRVAILFLIIATTSPGMFHASVAYLPSSFAMYAAMLGGASFMDWQHGLKTAQGIFWFALGACLGWPFAVALSMPFLLEGAVLAFISDADARLQFVTKVCLGTAASLLMLALQVLVDAVFYRKLTIVPLNIVLYNVFSSRGPDLYGTEPWHFYLRNLALNFHIWFLLALVALPLLLAQLALGAPLRRHYRGLTILAPFYLWLAIFTLQPHKEERFIYPAYPFLILNAAFSLHSILAFLGNTSPRSLISRIPVMLRLSFIMAFIMLAMAVSALRVAGTWTAFSAPLHIYEPLMSVQHGGNVCLGKEWYRFPSHYLLPEGFHAKFVRSEFHGLLPGEFAANTTGLYGSTWLEPSGMNDENLEDVSKYTDIDQCDLLVDSSLPSTIPTAREPDYVSDMQTWQKLRCLPFLDAASTGVLGRLIWTPDSPFLPAALRRVWGEYCLLKRASVA